MYTISKFLIEQELESIPSVPYIIHEHTPRSGSKHYDLRFLDNKDKKILHSFAFGTYLLDKLKSGEPALGAKTKNHNPRWLTLKSYRLKTIETGECKILINTSKFMEVVFYGEIIKDRFRLFNLKTKRKDNWLLSKVK